MKNIISLLFITFSITTATAQGGVCGNTILSDDFSSATGWQSVGNGDVNIGNGKCNFANVYGGTYNKVLKSLGTTLSDNYWKAECNFSILNANPSGKGANGEVIALTAGNLDFISYDASQGYAETDQDGIAVYLKRTSSGTTLLSIFSDATRTTHLPGSPVTFKF